RSVTLFEDRAEVRRRLVVSLVPGTHTIHVGPLTPVVDERSLQASIVVPDGADSLPARITAARVHWRVISAAEERDEEIGVLEQQLRDAERHRIAMDQQRTAVYERRQRLHRLHDQW